jgi:hypothetical protein
VQRGEDGDSNVTDLVAVNISICCSPKALLLHFKRFALVEKPRIESAVVDAKENNEEPKGMTAVEMTVRKNKVRIDKS